MAAGLASMLTNLLPLRHVDREGELATAFGKEGATIDKRAFYTDPQVRELLRDQRVEQFFGRFEREAQILYLENRDQQILCWDITSDTRKTCQKNHGCGSLSPRHGASSGCGWKNGLLYGG
jgi:hypothetical protein